MRAECRCRRARIPVVLLSLLLVTSAFTGSAFASGAETEVPALVESADPERPWPFFVAAELAVTPSGAVAEDLFHLGAASTIRNAFERQREPSERDCIRWGESYDFGVTTPRLDSVTDLVAHSSPIVRGQVVGSRPGFSSAVPGQLLKVEVLEQLKGGETLSYAYVFFPVGRLEVGGEVICKTDVRYADAPEEGADILIFGQGLREEAAEPFFRLPDNGTGIVVLGDSGNDRDLPRVLREENPGRGGRDVLRDVRALLGSSRQPGEDGGEESP